MSLMNQGYGGGYLVGGHGSFAKAGDAVATNTAAKRLTSFLISSPNAKEIRQD
jgi:hypothetical protein